MRVLIEHENPQVAAAIARDLEAAGHAVVICHGPSRRAGRECPLLAGESCELVEDTDVVLAGLPLDKLRVYISLRERYDQPIVLSLSEAQRARFPVLEQLGPWVARTLSGRELTRALEAAVESAASP